MRSKIVGITILGVLTYFIYKHYKKSATHSTNKNDNEPVYVYTPIIIDEEVIKSSKPIKPIKQNKSISFNESTIAPGYRPLLNPVYTQSTYKAPYDITGFGRDSSRNTDSIDPDSYLYMPLESEGITHANKDLYTAIEVSVDEKIPTRFKYIRITFKRIRNSDTLSLGGIRFMLSKDRIRSSVQLWNPYTGEKRPYSWGPIQEADQKTFVFVFSELTQINRYEFKSSFESTDMDPTSWIVEGSLNGTYWVLLDEQSKIRMPIQRGNVIPFTMQNLAKK